MVPSPYTYTVVRSQEANACVLPGNHIFVFTGILRYVKNEDELAAVLGHEMGHNLARHAGERISENLVMGVVRMLSLLVDPTGTLMSLLLPAQALLWSLPHSREHEAEADRIGVILASHACYDPRAAKRVFSRMKADAESDSESARPPEFLSTHPSDDTRLALFDQWMPAALAQYDGDGGGRCGAVREEMRHARRIAAAKMDGKEGK